MGTNWFSSVTSHFLLATRQAPKATRNINLPNTRKTGDIGVTYAWADRFLSGPWELSSEGYRLFDMSKVIEGS